MDPGTFALIAAVVFVGSALQGSIGFGAGMVAAPVIALVEPELLPALVVMFACLLALMVTLRERAHLDLGGAAWALAGRLPGSALGALLVLVLPVTALSWVVVASVVVGVGSAFLGWRPAPTRTALVTAGALSGIMGTSTSIGGAPMAIVWQGQEPARLRGTMSAFFLVGSITSVLLLAAVGSVTWNAVQVVLWLIPAVAAGFLLSRRLNRWLDAERLRLAGLVLALGGAGLLVVRLLLEM
ncbi:sulfite exporter TauE/SafE family protein [Citricoccus sp. I39-566]|uniref:sulfite exporter TauE/SafE family protein n=1 Tax=Citricoccus sp. I39-566 TaxID=3073268 RepID=UPI00286ABBDC|nr:sulfite exporter TauE/SafE family protein [Citricoccus sp. I39-566]WMY77927.1 sulfite exporter TauE/SafE family protein [Citricoccus sp. I39-566]